MTIDDRFSHKMTVLSVVAMLSVVFIHSVAYSTMAHPARWNVFGEILITRSFTRWAVPYFFLMSGFWFGRGKFIQCGDSYLSLLKTKSRTLLVPYVCWCILGFLISLPLILVNNVLGRKPLWERTIIAIPGIWAKLDAFLGITLVGPESNAPLWYVRSLVLLFVLSPVLRCFIRRRGGLLLLGLGAVFCLLICPLDLPHLKVPTLAFSWFAIGTLLAQFKIEGWHIPLAVSVVAMVGLVVTAVVLSLMRAQYLTMPVFLRWLNFYRMENALIPVFGIIFICGLYDYSPSLRHCKVLWCVRQTFFIYCIHERVCGYLLATIKFTIGKTDTTTLAASLIVPPVAFLISAYLALAINCFAPRFYSLICGGRK